MSIKPAYAALLIIALLLTFSFGCDLVGQASRLRSWGRSVCGNGKVEGTERCELSNTSNSPYCKQSTTICSGAKARLRDSYGNCGTTCKCVLDAFGSAQCAKGKCGATCSSAADCDDANPSTVDACNLTSTCACTHTYQSTCTPVCAGKQCGDNGCGGSCGTCQTGSACNADGQCIASCTPLCSGKTCGSNGCSGTCGTCPSGSTCNTAGQCVASCTPSCSGKTCGSDGCSGNCGTCSSGSTCSSAGQCVASCTNDCSSSGSKQCSGTTGYQTCGNYDSDSCLEWSSVTACASGQACSGGQCGSTAPSSGKTLYVSPSGSDSNAGTISAPYKTIQKGLSAVAGGGTLYLRAGTYTALVTISQSGTASSPINMSAYPGDHVLIDVTSQNTGEYDAAITLTGSYINVQNLEVINPNGRGVTIDGSHNRFDGLDVHNTGSSACFIDGQYNTVTTSSFHEAVSHGIAVRAPNNLIDGNRIYHTVLFNDCPGGGGNCNGDWSSALATGDTGSGDVGTNTIFRNNQVYENYGEGIICMNSKNILIENNKVWDNLQEDVYIDQCSNVNITNNLVYYTSNHEYWLSSHPQAGIEWANEGVPASYPICQNLRIYNNIIVNTGYGLAFAARSTSGTAIKDTVVAYNTLVNNNEGISFDAPVGTNSNSVIENNIVMGGSPFVVGSTAGLTFTHNLYSSKPSYLGTGDLVGNPLLVSAGNSVDSVMDPNWYKLTSTSPAIGKAQSVAGITTDFFVGTRDSTPDIGANEYASTSCTPLCSGKVCGSDGCSGSCGSCTGTQNCNSAGQCVSSGSGSTYYVSTSGLDTNAGSINQPYKTIQKCLNTVAAGDTCLIRAGTYNEALNLVASGSSGKVITLQNYNGEVVTVNSGSSMTLKTTGKQSYYLIDGLRFISTASGDEGKYTIDLTSVGLSNGWPYDETATVLGNNHITLQNCYVEGAIILYGSYNTVQNCEFNGRNVLNDGIRSYLAASTNTLIRNNTIHDYTGRAVWINVIADNASVVGNNVYNTWLGIDCDGASKPVTNCHVLKNIVTKSGQGSSHTGWGCSVFLENAFKAVVEGNLLYNSAGGLGIYVINYGIGGGNPQWNTDGKIEYRTQDLNAVISNNIIYGNGDGAVKATSANGVQFYDNTVSGTIYLVSEDNIPNTVYYYSQHWTVRNNIFSGGTAWSAQSTTSYTSSTFSNNLYSSSGAKSPGETALSGDPKFVSSTNYHLQSGSPAINSGYNLGSLVPDDFDGIARPQGAGYDLGAYEYH